MKRIVNWEDIQTGDLGWHVGLGDISEAISHLTYRKDLENLGFKTPSHIFIVLNKTQVIEALEKTKVRLRMEYKEAFDAGRVYIFRPESVEEATKTALMTFYLKFNNHPYGWLQILGFLPVIALRKMHLSTPNLFPLGTICSEDGLLYLRMLMQELGRRGNTDLALKLGWTVNLDRNTTDPALLLMCCLFDEVPKSLHG